MVKSGVAYTIMIIGALLAIIGAYFGVGGMTGFVSLEDVTNDEPFTDSVKLSANIDNTDGNLDSVWAVIWDNTGGVLWQGLLFIVNSADPSNEHYEVEVDITSPPFPEFEGEETYDYTIYANTTSGEMLTGEGKFTVLGDTRQTNSFTLKPGWNMVSFTDTIKVGGSDRTLQLNKGWNLIGYSTNNLGLKPSEVLIDSSSFSNAVDDGKIQNRFAYYDSNRGTYTLISEDTSFKTNSAYWLYSNSAEEITFPDVGGSSVGKTIPLDNVILTHVKTGDTNTYLEFRKNYSFEIKYYDSIDMRFKPLNQETDNIEAWKGYFFYNPFKDEFTVTLG